MKATFENSVNVLVKAYLNNTLLFGNDCACAVGNLLSDANGWPQGQAKTDWFHHLHLRHTKETRQRAIKHISRTGYTIPEIRSIERAFETTPYSYDKDQRMFNGMMRVVDVLAEIHNIDLTAKESAKKLFVKP